MSKITKIHQDCLDHSYDCDIHMFCVFHNVNEDVAHNKIKCSCGFEREIPFSSALESPNDYINLNSALEFWNSPDFKEVRERANRIRKEARELEDRVRKEREIIRRNLEKRKNAISSLEIE